VKVGAVSVTVPVGASPLDGAFGALSEPQTKWVKKINMHSMRLNEMISDILDLSKLQSGKSQMKRSPVDVGKMITSTVANLQIMAKEKKLSMTAAAMPALPPLWGDPSRLEQVLTNLITNAIKYTPAEGRIEVSARQAGSAVQVCVQDTGLGVAPENREIIFDRFRQIRSQEKNEPSTQGIGLGLAICKEIIDQHQGRIWVDSAPGNGSRFQFELPIDARGQAQPPMNVLVVDDDVEISQLLQMSLEQEGYNVTVSRNGKHAIQLIEDNTYDLIYLDLMLPGASGAEVIKAVRQMKVNTEIIVVTAYPNSELLFEGMATGPITVVGKPFDTTKLIDMARKKAA
jgi:CheY-like chemotaxis protein/two-component sensor histidine kinase